MGENSVKYRINFVCTGNICRSPMAEVVFQKLVDDAGLTDYFTIASSGTGDWHVGEPADPRTVEALAKQGLDGSQHRAKQFEYENFENHDLIIALDRGHLRTLNNWARKPLDAQKVQLLLSFEENNNGNLDVEDPYYADEAAFDTVLEGIQSACKQLFQQIQPAIQRK